MEQGQQQQNQQLEQRHILGTNQDGTLQPSIYRGHDATNPGAKAETYKCAAGRIDIRPKRAAVFKICRVASLRNKERIDER